jgi:hypothetical protein
MRRCAGVLIAMLVSSAAVAQQGTTIKGYYLGMQEIKSTEFDVKKIKNETYLMAKNSNPDLGIYCARFEGDQSGVKVMAFKKCMFNANDLTDDQFARSLVDSYKLPSLSCQPYTYHGYDNNLKFRELVGKKCSGLSKHGELITIDGDRITFEQRDKKPTFD